HLNVGWFLKWGRGLPNQMLSVVATGLLHGFPTFYRGGGIYFRDYSSSLSPEDEQRAIEKAKESVEKGWAIGPFDRVPFSNNFRSHQAIVTKLFTIPKHK